MNQDRYSLIDNANTSNAQESGYGSGETRTLYQVNFKKLPQYVATFAATLSALAAGTVLGWTSPILEDLEAGNFRNIPLTNSQIGWIGSFATLGGMAMCIPTGFICDLIGRKKTLLLLFVPFTIGWLLIIFANNVLMLYFGRLVTGLASGASCIAAPLYTSEIAHKSLRGTLGSYFQLMVTIGIFLAYIFGKYLSAIHFTIWCACLPSVFLILFAFQPESPVYLLKRGLYDEAKMSLLILRGKHNNVDMELNEIEGYLKEITQTRFSLSQSFRQRSIFKALLISMALMFYQQFSGINVVILYTSKIFKNAGVVLDPKTASILVGSFQVIATFIASLIVDKSGRRILLLISSFFITVTTLVLGIYFSIKIRIDDHLAHELGFLPVVALCVFIVAYSLGLGPIPWIISSEIFPTEIKSIASSTAGTLNWFLAFILTKFYLDFTKLIGEDGTFYIFTIASFTGILFVYLIIPETKGRNIAEIQAALEQ